MLVESRWEAEREGRRKDEVSELTREEEGNPELMCWMGRTIYPSAERLPSSVQSAQLREQTYEKDGKSWWPHKKKSGWLPTIPNVRPSILLTSSLLPSDAPASSPEQGSSTRRLRRIRTTSPARCACTLSRGGKRRMILGMSTSTLPAERDTETRGK